MKERLLSTAASRTAKSPTKSNISVNALRPPSKSKSTPDTTALRSNEDRMNVSHVSVNLTSNNAYYGQVC